MSVERRPSSSSDTRTLLEERPPSYHSTDDVSNPPPPVDVTNKISRVDTCWILAGLWSGVLLGAFDGTLRTCLSKYLTANYQQEPSLQLYYRQLGANLRRQINLPISVLHICYPYVVSHLFMVSHVNHIVIWTKGLTANSGRLADILGRKGAMLVALSLFGTILWSNMLHLTNLLFNRIWDNILWNGHFDECAHCCPCCGWYGRWRVSPHLRSYHLPLLLLSRSI